MSAILLISIVFSNRDELEDPCSYELHNPSVQHNLELPLYAAADEKNIDSRVLDIPGQSKLTNTQWAKNSRKIKNGSVMS